ncbi:unnamed protein product, partial [Prorocentrum cordatum]
AQGRNVGLRCGLGPEGKLAPSCPKAGTAPGRRRPMRAILAAVRPGGKQSSPDVSPDVSPSRKSCSSLDVGVRRVSSSKEPPRRSQTRPLQDRNSQLDRQTSHISQPCAEQWTAEERAAYIASLNLARLPAEASVQRFLEDALCKAKLPAPWTATRHENGRLYFSNPYTAVSSWHHPLTHVLEELADICRRVLSMPEENRAEWIAAKRGIWMGEANEYMTKWYVVPHSSGRKFYYHRETQDTMWENPVEVVLPQYHLKIEAVARLNDVDYVRKLLQEEELLAAAFSLPQAVIEDVPLGVDMATFNLARLQDKLAAGSPAGRSRLSGSSRESHQGPDLDALLRQWDTATGEVGWQQAEAASFQTDRRDQTKVDDYPHADILLVSASRRGTPSQSDQEPRRMAHLGERGPSKPQGSSMLDDLHSRTCTSSSRVPASSSSCVSVSKDAPRLGSGFSPQPPPLPLDRSAATRTPPPPPVRPSDQDVAQPSRPLSCESDAGREDKPNTSLHASLPAMPLQRAATSGFRTRPPSPPSRFGATRSGLAARRASETPPAVVAPLQASPPRPKQAAAPPAMASALRGAAQVGPVAPVPPPPPPPFAGASGREPRPPSLTPPERQDQAAWAAPEPMSAAEPPGDWRGCGLGPPASHATNWADPRRSSWPATGPGAGGGPRPRPDQLPPKLQVLAPPISAVA